MSLSQGFSLPLPGNFISAILDQNMTIGIRRRAWRGGVVALLIALIVVVTCLILLGLMADFLVDWLWFSAVGYLNVFWTIIIAEAEVFLAVFVATAIILWANGSLASRLARSPWTQRPADVEWKRTGVDTMPDLLEFMQHRLPWPIIIARLRRLPRCACRPVGGSQLGRFFAIPLSGVLWRE